LLGDLASGLRARGPFLVADFVDRFLGGKKQPVDPHQRDEKHDGSQCESRKEPHWSMTLTVLLATGRTLVDKVE
jgi:hypothetical protein